MTIKLTQDQADILIDAIDYLADDLDMDNMLALGLLQQVKEKLPKQKSALIY